MIQDLDSVFEKVHPQFANDIRQEEDVAALTQRLKNTRNPFKRRLIAARIDNLNHKSSN